jgi:hypothetical protein
MPASTEPVAATEAVRSLVLAVLAVLLAFNAVNPTQEQTAAILGLVTAGSVMLSVFARLRSTPTSKVALTTAQATALAPPPPEPPTPVTAAEVERIVAEGLARAQSPTV